MNKELMLVATGIGIGALAFTDQGRKLMNAVMGPSFLPSLGESDNDPRRHHEKKAIEEDKHHREESRLHEEEDRRHHEEDKLHEDDRHHGDTSMRPGV